MILSALGGGRVEGSYNPAHFLDRLCEIECVAASLLLNRFIISDLLINALSPRGGVIWKLS